MRWINGRSTLRTGLVSMIGLAAPARADTFDLNWNTIDGGGATFSTGGGYSLAGTIGQPDAGAPMSGGGYSLTGGFWPGALTTPARLRADMNCDGVINNFDIDPFVLAIVNAPAYIAAFPNCNILNADIDNTGTVTNFDIDPFVVCVVNFGCP